MQRGGEATELCVCVRACVCAWGGDLFILFCEHEFEVPNFDFLVSSP